MVKLPVKHIRASVFGLVILCFLLPFVVVSCPQHGSAKVSGMEIAFGRTIRGESLSSVTNDQRILPQVLAILALACAVAGIVFSYLKKNTAFALCTAASIGGIVLLVLLRNRINAQGYILRGEGLVLRYEVGYSLAVAAFILALVVTLAFNPSSKMSLLTVKRKKR
jgi:hypothetical protein